MRCGVYNGGVRGARSGRHKAVSQGATLALVVWTAGCTPSQAAFTPVEATRQIAPALSASYYELNVQDNNYGDVKVWSPGAYPTEVDGVVPMIHIRLRIRNDSTEPLELGLQEMDVSLVTEGYRYVVVDDLEVTRGESTIPPQSMRRLALQVAIPPGLGPGGVEGFELNWQVKTPGGIYTQSTPFVQRVNGDYYYWRPYYYGPYWRPFYGYNWPYYGSPYFRDYGYSPWWP